MRIITARPVRTSTATNQENSSNFITKKMRDKMSANRANRKANAPARKAARQEKRAMRKMARAERGKLFAGLKAKTANFWAKRKAKRAERLAQNPKKPLFRKKKGDRALVVNELKSIDPNKPAVFNDVLPTISTDPSGKTIKTNPDGTIVPINPDAKIISVTAPSGEQVSIDQTDLNNRNVSFDEDDNPVVEYGEEEVAEYNSPSGIEIYRDEENTGFWKSLSGTQKGLFITGGVVVVGAITYLVIRYVKSKKS